MTTETYILDLYEGNRLRTPGGYIPGHGSTLPSTVPRGRVFASRELAEAAGMRWLQDARPGRNSYRISVVAA